MYCFWPFTETILKTISQTVLWEDMKSHSLPLHKKDVMSHSCRQVNTPVWIKKQTNKQKKKTCYVNSTQILVNWHHDEDTDNTNVLVYEDVDYGVDLCERVQSGCPITIIQFEPWRQRQHYPLIVMESSALETWGHKGWRKVSLKSSLGIELDICMMEEHPQTKAQYSVSSPLHIAVCMRGSYGNTPHPPLCESFRCSKGWNFAPALICLWR